MNTYFKDLKADRQSSIELLKAKKEKYLDNLSNDLKGLLVISATTSKTKVDLGKAIKKLGKAKLEIEQQSLNDFVQDGLTAKLKAVDTAKTKRDEWIKNMIIEGFVVPEATKTGYDRRLAAKSKREEEAKQEQAKQERGRKNKIK